MLACDGLPDRGGTIPEEGGELDALGSTLCQNGAGAGFLFGTLAKCVSLALRLSPSLPQSPRTLLVPIGGRPAQHQRESGNLPGPTHDGSLVKTNAVGGASDEEHGQIYNDIRCRYA